MDYERTKRIDRTKTGVLLLLIGTLLSWIPGIGFVGDVLILVGAILVILGRKAFGAAHARNVVISIVLFVVGVIVVIGVAVAATLANLGSILPPGSTTPTVTPAFLASVASAGLLGGIVSAIVIGIAEVLFTYALQAQTGKVFLWAAYGANIALAIALYLILSPLYNAVLTDADYNAVLAAQTTYGLLNVLPAALFAVADYLAWSRISKREIPAPSPLTPMGMPPIVPPQAPPRAPPMPPQAPPPSGPAPPINPQ